MKAQPRKLYPHHPLVVLMAAFRACSTVVPSLEDWTLASSTADPSVGDLLAWQRQRSAGQWGGYRRHLLDGNLVSVYWENCGMCRRNSGQTK